MDPDSAVIRSLSDEFHLSVATHEDFPEQLAVAINHLVKNDFSRLVQILYKMDISEVRLRRMLTTSAGEDAGLVIARLLIERERQKILSRKKFKRDDDIPEDEKW
jgi:hypothetical protein